MSVSLISRSQRSEIRSIGDLGGGEIARMRELFLRHFQAAPAFEEDLLAKRWAVLLWQEQRLLGFSSLGVKTLPDSSRVYYSGDTVVDPEGRGGFGLAQAWSGHVFEQAAAEPERRHWWFLICSGYRTYRYLPLFFQEFYPRYDRVTPPLIEQRIESLGEELYPGRYQSGVIRLQSPSALLDAKIPPGRLKDPHVGFFLKRNPGHDQGDELACLTEIHPDNLTRAGRRMVEV